MPTSPPRRARANAFDIARTDRDDPAPASAPIGRILGPPPAAPAPQTAPDRVAPASRTAPSQAAPARTPQTSPTPDVERRPRGSGGRAAATATRITVTPARIPISLYEETEHLVKGPGRPSWGQLVAATCQHHQDDVTAAVVDSFGRDQSSRPRGQNRSALPTTQISARFTPDEADSFSVAVRTATVRVRQSCGDDIPVTATAVVIAALKVARRSTSARSH